MSVILLLVVAAFIATVASALNRCPLWVAVLFLCVIAMLQVMPVGR